MALNIGVGCFHCVEYKVYGLLDHKAMQFDILSLWTSCLPTFPILYVFKVLTEKGGTSGNTE